jgi:hypothetical protein
MADSPPDPASYYDGRGLALNRHAIFYIISHHSVIEMVMG